MKARDCCCSGLALPQAWDAGDVSPPGQSHQADLTRLTRARQRQSLERMCTNCFVTLTTAQSCCSLLLQHCELHAILDVYFLRGENMSQVLYCSCFCGRISSIQQHRRALSVVKHALRRRHGCRRTGMNLPFVMLATRLCVTARAAASLERRRHGPIRAISP